MNQRETLFTELGVLEEPGPAIPEAFRDSAFVFLANTHPQEQLRLLAEFPNRRLAVIDTMNLWINIARDELRELLTRIDGIVLNDEEAQMLTEVRNPITAGRKILEMGPSFVIIKKGEHGCTLVHENGLATLPAFPAAAHEVVDPTGAGDAFAGGLMGHIASSASGSGDVAGDLSLLQNAMAWGTVTASFTIESFSLQRLVCLRRAEIDDRLALFRRIARVG
jgi:sugar/nucleoside kinase (ribokinase family)